MNSTTISLTCEEYEALLGLARLGLEKVKQNE